MRLSVRQEVRVSVHAPLCGLVLEHENVYLINNDFLCTKIIYSISNDNMAG